MSNFVNEFQANSVYTQTLTAQDSIETSLLTINGVNLEDKLVTAGTGLTKTGNVISINPNQTLASLTTTGIITVPFGENLRFQRWDGNSGNCMLGVLATSGGNDTTFIMRNQSYAGIIDFTTTHNLSKVVFNTPTVSVNGTTDSTSPTTGALRVLGGVGVSKGLRLGADLAMSGTGQFSIDYPNVGAGRFLIDNDGTMTLARGICMILNTSESTGITSGALKVGGGIACTKSLHVGGDLFVNNPVGSRLKLVSPGNQFFVGSVPGDQVGEFHCYDNTGNSRVFGWYRSSNNFIIGYQNGTTNTICAGTSDSISATSGSLQVLGGVGIAKSVNVGGQMIVTGNTTFSSTTTLNNLNIVSSVNQPFNLSMSTAAMGAGGVSAFSNYLKPGMGANETSTVGFGQSNSTRNMGYLGYTYVANNSNSNCMTVGLHGVDRILNVYGDGRVLVTTTSDSSAYNNGSFIVAGGTGIGKNLNVGGSLNVSGNFNVTGTFTASNLNGINSGVNTTDYISFGGLTPTTVTTKDINYAKNGNIAHYSVKYAYTGSTGTWNGYVFIKTQTAAAYRDRWVKVVCQFYNTYWESWGYVRNDEASKGLVMNIDPATVNALNQINGEWYFSFNFQSV